MIRRSAIGTVAPFVAFVLLALAFVAPALPGTGMILGGEDLYYFRPPFSELRPADLIDPSNALLGDAVEVFHPDLEWTVEQVRRGELPLWNPYVGAGWPQLASQQTAPLFPLNLPAFVLPFWESLGLIAALRIVLAATGTFLLCRSAMGLRPASGALAAVAFAAGVYFIAWLEHPHGAVYALLPWLLIAVDRIVRHGRLGDGAALGAVLGLACLAGHPQSVLIDAFVVGPFAAWRVTRSGQAALGRTAVDLRRITLLLAGGVSIGVAAGAVMLLPLVEFLRASATHQRGGLGGIQASSLITAMLPEFWGRPDQRFVATGPINYFERTIYVGAPALLLAVAGLAIRRSAAQLFFAVMALAGVLGAVTLPVITPIVDNAPPFSLVAMARMLVVTSFALAILAGFGLDRVLATDATGRRRAIVVVAVVAALPVAWLLVARLGSLASLGDAVGALPAITGEPDTADAAVLGAVLRWTCFALPVVALLLLLRERPRVVTAIVGALLALQAIDLVELGRGLHPVIDQEVVELGPTPALAHAIRDRGSGRTTGSDAYLLPNESTRFGLRDMRARGQPTISRIDALYVAYSGALPRTFSVDWPRAGALLDVFGVGQVLTGARTADPTNQSLKLIAASVDDRLYRNTTALPRAYVATSWRRPQHEVDAIAMTASSTTDQLRQAPVVELASGPPAVEQPSGGEARFLVDGANRVTLEVSSDRPGRLVLLDAYYPGWKATVNDRSEEILPTNGAFRSVAVPAGRSTVEFRYRPLSVYVGAAISFVAWTILILVGLAAVVARRRARRA